MSLFRRNRKGSEDSILGSNARVKSLYPSTFVSSGVRGESLVGISQAELDKLDLSNSTSQTFLLDTFSKLFDQGNFDEFYFKNRSIIDLKALLKTICSWRLLLLPFLPLLLLKKFFCTRKSEGIVISVFMVFLLVLLYIIYGILWLIILIPKLMISLIVKKGIRSLVEHGYQTRCMRFLHVDCCNMISKISEQEKFWHSRFLDLRVDFYVKLNIKVSIFMIPQLSDNFAYLIVDHATLDAIIIDCGESTSAFFAIRKISYRFFGGEDKLRLKAILSTHKHWDHAGGNRYMKKKLPGLRIYGHYLDNVDACTDQIKDEDIITINDNLSFEVVSMRCLLFLF